MDIRKIKSSLSYLKNPTWKSWRFAREKNPCASVAAHARRPVHTYIHQPMPAAPAQAAPAPAAAPVSEAVAAKKKSQPAQAMRLSPLW